MIKNLREQGVFAHLHYIPIHIQPYYKKLGFKMGDFPNAETYYRQAITLPLFPELTLEDVEFIVEKLTAEING